jgi:hypothetical protein
MKPNAFQKILSLIYLMLLTVCCIFYVPFKDIEGSYDTEIFYDGIWSDNSNIDFYRIGIYLVLLSIVYFFIYRYLIKMNDLPEVDFKIKARFELKTFIVFVTSIAICFLFIFIWNNINHYYDKSLKQEIQKRQAVINEKSSKREAKKSVRSDFWRESYKTFNLQPFDNNIQNYWVALIKSINNNIWLTSYYEKFPNNSLKQFNIKSPSDLKHFIEINAYDNEDVTKEKEVKILNKELNQIIEKRSNITIYKYEEIRKIILVFLCIMFGLLYILRPLYIFVKGIFEELK